MENIVNELCFIKGLRKAVLSSKASQNIRMYTRERLEINERQVQIDRIRHARKVAKNNAVREILEEEQKLGNEVLEEELNNN